MTNEEILANAPEGATHYIKNGNYEYWKLTYINGYQAFTHTTKNLINVMPDKLYNIRSLADIRRIAGLERELGQEKLPTEQGCNRYGLDMSYFRNVINRELNRPLTDYKPDELARVFARLSRTADESVMFEPEFSNKRDLSKELEATHYCLELIEQISNARKMRNTIQRHYAELRKQQEGEL